MRSQARQDLTEKATEMERTIRVYFEGCNEADTEKMSACFVPDAVHYFPQGMPNGPWRGAQTIAKMWVDLVERIGSKWTIERVLCDPGSNEAVIEWTHWKTGVGTYLRGDEWYVFDSESGLIREIRAYYAAPADPSVSHELEGFDYSERGYALVPPEVNR